MQSAGPLSPIHAVRHQRSDKIPIRALERTSIRLLSSSSRTHRICTTDRYSRCNPELPVDRQIRNVPSRGNIALGYFTFLPSTMHRAWIPCSTAEPHTGNRGTKTAPDLLGVLHSRPLQFRNPRPPIRHRRRRHIRGAPHPGRRRSA